MTDRSAGGDGGARFPHLFSPLTLRSTTLRNRVVMLPMGIRLARDGRPTGDDIAFYTARAKGGVGLIVTGGTPMHPSSVLRARNAYEAFDPATMDALARLVDGCRGEGAAVFGQLYHRGREVLGASDHPTWAPSAVPNASDSQLPHVMTADEIRALVAAFASSAGLLRKRAGYDGIEIHGAHGYLVAQFLSPATNRREDAYGGSPTQRMRFLLEIVDAIRAEVDADCVLGVRLSAEEGTENGLTLDDSVRIASALASTGKVDYLSVAVGAPGTYVRDMSERVGCAIPLAAAIKSASGLPVIASQRINHPPLAEEALAGGSADLIGMGRALIADAEWAAKARAGEIERIRPCVACIQDCRTPGPLRCAQSPTVGRERSWAAPRTRRDRGGKRVVVVGAGPAGLEAAVVAAERGHRVVVFEAQQRPGGQLRLAARAPHRAEIDGVVTYRVNELRRLGVPVRLGSRADARAVLAERPDAVVVATGALPTMGEIEGADLPHVVDVYRLMEPDVEADALIAGASSAAVVDDGTNFWETCSAAETLAYRGLRVHVISPGPVIGANVPPESLAPLRARLLRRGATLLPGHRVSAIYPGRLVVYDLARLLATHRLEERELAADVVVIYAGKRAVDDLAVALSGRIESVQLVGDALSPRRYGQAVFEGHRAARAL